MRNKIVKPTLIEKPPTFYDLAASNPSEHPEYDRYHPMSIAAGVRQTQYLTIGGVSPIVPMRIPIGTKNYVSHRDYNPDDLPK